MKQQELFDRLNDIADRLTTLSEDLESAPGYAPFRDRLLKDVLALWGVVEVLAEEGVS